LRIDQTEESIISVFQPTAFSENLSSDIQWGTEFADFYLWGTPNNYYPWGQVYYGRVFLGFAGNDFVTPLDDVPYDYDPSPSFYGGDGDDVLYTNSYYGHIVGGSGQDIIVGGKGDDYLYGDSEFEILNFYPKFPADIEFWFHFGRNRLGTEPIFQYAQNFGQYLDGETGDAYGDAIYFEDGLEGALRWLGMISNPNDPGGNDDYLSGGAGNDVIYGGVGQDILRGGDGDDELYGSNNAVDLYNASLLHWKDRPQAMTLRALFYEAGDDFLDGGAGNDKLIDNDGGNDYLLGGDGDDLLIDTSLEYVVFGSINYLDGGAGNDVLVARNSSSDGIQTQDVAYLGGHL
jgi:Ca2+-binding RTX toxin-like protein